MNQSYIQYSEHEYPYQYSTVHEVQVPGHLSVSILHINYQ